MKRTISFFLTMIFAMVSFVSAQDPNAFITTWEPTGTELRYPGVGTNYTIVVRNLTTNTVEQTITNATSPTVETTFVTITGLTANDRYSIEVTPGTGEFISFRTRGNAGRDKLMLKEMKQWGNIAWRSDMAYMFQQARNMELTATDKPDLSKVTVLTGFFNDASGMVGNASITDWNTGNVTSMASMFAGANVFNQPLNWNTEKVTNMTNMFSMANAFDQNIGNWTYHENVNIGNILNNSGLSVGTYDATLKSWDENTTFKTGKAVGVFNLVYSPVGKVYRDNLLNKGWSFLVSGQSYDGDQFDPDYIYSSNFQLYKDDLAVSVVNKHISVENITDLVPVHLFDLTGKLVSTKVSQGNKAEFQVANPGLYIVSAQNKQLKIIVR